MAYYIMYPKNKSNKVKVVTKRPKPTKGFGFAEGSFKSKEAVKRRLNMMDIKNRPRGF